MSGEHQGWGPCEKEEQAAWVMEQENIIWERKRALSAPVSTPARPSYDQPANTVGFHLAGSAKRSSLAHLWADACPSKWKQGLIRSLASKMTGTRKRNRPIVPLHEWASHSFWGRLLTGQGVRLFWSELKRTLQPRKEKARALTSGLS